MVVRHLTYAVSVAPAIDYDGCGSSVRQELRQAATLQRQSLRNEEIDGRCATRGPPAWQVDGPCTGRVAVAPMGSKK